MSAGRKPKLYPMDVDAMAKAIAIRGRGETVEELVRMYVDDVTAVYDKVDRAVANGYPADQAYTLAEHYSERLADYFNDIFRQTVRWHDKGNRTLWNIGMDATMRKENESLRRLKGSFEDMVRASEAHPKPMTKPTARIPKGQGDIIIYGKRKGDKRFKPFDGEGFTNKLIYAMHYPPSRAAQVAEMVDELNRMNPDYVFEMRRSGGSLYGGGER